MKHQEIYKKIVDKVHKMSDNELKDSILKANPQLVNDIKLSDNYNHALELSAQCWCDKETSGIEMDDRLAKAFATRLAYKIDNIKKVEEIAKIRLDYIRQLEAEKEAANIRIKRLEKAGDRLLTVMRGEEGTAYCEWVGLAYDAEQNWLKAKEDKP